MDVSMRPRIRLVGGAQPSQLGGNLHLQHPQMIGFIFSLTT